MPEDVQRCMWRKRESRNSGPESRWLASDLGRDAQAFKSEKRVISFVHGFHEVMPVLQVGEFQKWS